MAGGILATERRDRSRSGRMSSAASSGRGYSDIPWLPIMLGTTALVAGFGRRKNGMVALALTTFAGVTAVETLRGSQRDRGAASGKVQNGVSAGEPEVERSITIGKEPEELYQRWLDPDTVPEIMKSFATVRAAGEGVMHWKIEGPLGHGFEWQSETVNTRPGEGIGWRSLPSAAIPNEGSVSFRPAPAGRGTVVTLHLRFDPPGGALSVAAVRMLGTVPLSMAADRVLGRFKSLVETGEIPTTERQPAARADTR